MLMCHVNHIFAKLERYSLPWPVIVIWYCPGAMSRRSILYGCMSEMSVREECTVLPMPMLFLRYRSLLQVRREALLLSRCVRLSPDIPEAALSRPFLLSFPEKACMSQHHRHLHFCRHLWRLQHMSHCRQMALPYTISGWRNILLRTHRMCNCSLRFLSRGSLLPRISRLPRPLLRLCHMSVREAVRQELLSSLKAGR